MKITFRGTRGSIAVPGRDTTLYGGNTTCLEIVLETGTTLIIDAGTGIRRVGRMLAERNGSGPVYLLMTHVHWDHIIGFPFFATGLQKGAEVMVDGHPNAVAGLRHTFGNAMGGGFFPVKIEDLDIKISWLGALASGPLEMEGASVCSVPLRHPQGGMGFRIREGDRTVVFITDNELDDEESFRQYADFSAGADLLIHDAQYSPDEMPRRRGWGHSDYGSALELAARAEARRLVLFHHDPSRTDAETMGFEVICRDMARKRNLGLAVEAAREDTVIRL
jgi:phosphoribosyl 1,2-cyclic phosphodiesterase